MNRATIVAALMLVGCGPSSPPVETAVLQDDGLLADPVKARPELARRLRAAVSMRDGLVFVQSPVSLGVAILPPATSWVLLCGPGGISLHFANVAAEHDGQVAVADALDVPLAFAGIVSRTTCAELAPAIGKEILRILGGG